jgi:hypothetical protein
MYYAMQYFTAREFALKTDIIPHAVRQIARLGTLPNPIVNFNLELWTSWTIAGGGHGPFVVRSFIPADAKGPIDTRYHYGPIQKQFARSVYHPYGAIEASGRTVLTSTDYRRLNGTLAFQIAVH